MKKVIWKFPFPVTDSVRISMPNNAEILTVQTQSNQPCIWALVNAEYKKEDIYFQVIGTGHPIESDPGKYIGTFQLDNGLVFHLFELPF